MHEGLSFRQVMGVFPTGVTVVAAAGDDGRAYGLTVNSFTSVSVDPPLVLVCIDRMSSTHDALVRSPTFTVSILEAHQTELATRFAFDPSETRFRAGEWGEAAPGALVLDGVVGWAHCDMEAVHEGGDHSILVGRVRSMGVGEGEAMVFYRGRYGTVAP